MIQARSNFNMLQLARPYDEKLALPENAKNGNSGRGAPPSKRSFEGAKKADGLMSQRGKVSQAEKEELNYGSGDDHEMQSQNSVVERDRSLGSVFNMSSGSVNSVGQNGSVRAN